MNTTNKNMTTNEDDKNKLKDEISLIIQELNAQIP